MFGLRWIDWLVIIIVGIIICSMLININELVVSKNIDLFSVTSPLVFPFLIGISMLICWFVTIYSDIKTVHKKTYEESSKELLYDIGIVIVYIIGVLIYIAVIGKIGFIFGTIIFLIIAMVFMNYDEPKVAVKIRNAAIVSFITVPVLYYVFHEVFRVMLP